MLTDNKNRLLSWARKLSGTRNYALGLDEGSQALRYVLYDTVRKEILDWGTFLFNSPAQEKEKKLAAFLKDLSKNIASNKLGAINVNIQMPSVLIGRLQIAGGSKGEQSQLIRLALRSHLSFPVEESVYYCREYSPGGQPLEKAQEKAHFNFVAVQRSALTALMEPIADHFRVAPGGTIQGYAFESLIEALQLSQPDETTAFINMGRGITAITIFQNKKLIFQRDIPLAGQDITRSILIMYRDANTPENILELGEAEKLKKGMSIPMGIDSDASHPERAAAEAANHKLYDSVKGVLAAWVQDVRLTFHYFYEQYQAPKISKVYVLGGSSNLTNFIPYLRDQLGIETQLLTIPETHPFKISSAKDSTELKQQFHEYATALAFALKDPGYANLILHKTSKSEITSVIAPVFRIVYALVAALLITWYLFLNVQIQNAKEVREALQEHHLFLKKIESPYVDMMAWKQFIEKPLLDLAPASWVMKGLSRRVQKNMLMTKIAIQRDQNAMTLEGRLYGNPRSRAVAMAEFSRLLQEGQLVRKIEIPQMEPSSAREDEGVFRLTAQLMKKGSS